MNELSFSFLDQKDQEYTFLAKEISNSSYDPYTQFYVGVVILWNNGKIYTGCNINTASYLGICAEQSAIAQMVQDQCYGIHKIYLYCQSENFPIRINSGPCGTCRMLIYEFAELQDNDPEIYITNSDLTETLVTSIQELYPKWVGPILGDGYIKKYKCF